jgi:sugar O-acyltransferase (sialic acid O-acetyltransferase NeuD family)
MPIEEWVVVGAGGHARVVMDALLSMDRPDSNISFVYADDDEKLHGQSLLGRVVTGSVSSVAREGKRFHVAIGSNAIREKVFLHLLKEKCLPFSAIHVASIISKYATVNDGVFVAAKAVLAPLSIIETGVIVNHGAVIDHDCIVGEFSHIAPGVTLAGGSRIGKNVLVGAGANVLPGIHIGDDAIVGAGAVVTKDVPPSFMVAGIPAKKIKDLQI